MDYFVGKNGPVSFSFTPLPPSLHFIMAGFKIKGQLCSSPGITLS